MNTVKQILLERKEYLETIFATKHKHESLYSVYAIKHGQGYQYYRKSNTGVEYIKARDINLVKEIVQSEYDTRVLLAAEKEYKKLKDLLNIYNEKTVDTIYESMPAGKRILVTPEELTDEEFVLNWNLETYEKLGFREDAPELYSSKGERMRSKSEMLIANILDKMKVPYKYEKPLNLKRMGIVHPDFTILDVKNRKEIYWEHLGMLDDQVYRINSIKKIREYENSGYYVGDRLIITEDSANCPLDLKSIERKVRFMLGL